MRFKVKAYSPLGLPPSWVTMSISIKPGLAANLNQRLHFQEQFPDSVLFNKPSVAEAARTLSLTVAAVERWKERFLTGAENALRSRPRDEETQKEVFIQRLERKVGRMALEIDIMQEAMKPYLTLRQSLPEYGKVLIQTKRTLSYASTFIFSSGLIFVYLCVP